MENRDMKYLHLKNTLFSMLSACLLIASFSLCLSSPASAQTEDSEPPVIGLDGAVESIREDLQKFTVTVTDNDDVDTVVFHYRLKSSTDNEASNDYLSSGMLQVGQSDEYTFTVPASDIASSVDSIEYYIEAQDVSGNRTLQGFFFDPLVRALVEKPVVASTEKPSGSLLDSLSTTEKVLYGALGVVVVGALISASSNGGGDEPAKENVPVVIVGDPPTVNAP